MSSHQLSLIMACSLFMTSPNSKMRLAHDSLQSGMPVFDIIVSPWPMSRESSTAESELTIDPHVVEVCDKVFDMQL